MIANRNTVGSRDRKSQGHWNAYGNAFHAKG
jgi:hypothetical protein